VKALAYEDWPVSIVYGVICFEPHPALKLIMADCYRLQYPSVTASELIKKKDAFSTHFHNRERRDSTKVFKVS